MSKSYQARMDLIKSNFVLNSEFKLLKNSLIDINTNVGELESAKLDHDSKFLDFK